MNSYAIARWMPTIFLTMPIAFISRLSGVISSAFPAAGQFARIGHSSSATTKEFVSRWEQHRLAAFLRHERGWESSSTETAICSMEKANLYPTMLLLPAPASPVRPTSRPGKPDFASMTRSRSISHFLIYLVLPQTGTLENTFLQDNK